MTIKQSPLPTSGKLPTFLGIDVESDPNYERQLSKLFTSAFQQAGEPKPLVDDFKLMVSTNQTPYNWKFPNTHHVTTLFIGGNKSKLKQPEYEFFQEGKSVEVTIRAVIYVPEQLVAGICFPKTEIENDFPHITLMVS